MRLDTQRDAPRRLRQRRPARRLARTLRSWEPELLAYFDSRLTNGPTEGTNRIIKAVKRQGFGYTNAENYRWRVLYRCA